MVPSRCAPSHEQPGPRRKIRVLETTADPKRVKTLLIVDDEPSSLAVLAQILQPHYRVRAARGGNAALAALRAETPDLVLLDVMMPDLDGFAVLKRMRDDPHTAEIPVVFVTALGADEEEERGLRLGAVDFLTKPVRPPIVLARVRTHLALKEARDRLHDQNHWLEAEVERRARATTRSPWSSRSRCSRAWSRRATSRRETTRFARRST